MKNNEKIMKNIIVHIKYPYTAVIITIMWLSMAIIVINQDLRNLETLVILTSLCTLIIAFVGFKSPK